MNDKTLFNITYALKGPNDEYLARVEAITCEQYIQKYVGDLDSGQSQILYSELYENP